MQRRGRNRLPAVIGLLAFSLAALAFLACGEEEVGEVTPSPPAMTPATTPSPGATAAETPEPEGASVQIRDFEFDPQTVTVPPGGTVTWTNEGPSTHTATADDGSFDSGNLPPGETFSRTFDEPGTYDYHCAPHPFMTAQVIVEE